MFLLIRIFITYSYFCFWQRTHARSWSKITRNWDRDHFRIDISRLLQALKLDEPFSVTEYHRSLSLKSIYSNTTKVKANWELFIGEFHQFSKTHLIHNQSNFSGDNNSSALKEGTCLNHVLLSYLETKKSILLRRWFLTNSNVFLS